jgi:hypothetical protein
MAPKSTDRVLAKNEEAEIISTVRTSMGKTRRRPTEYCAVVLAAVGVVQLRTEA